MQCKEPELAELPERLVACVSYTGNYIGNTALFERLFTRLGSWANEKGLFTAETVFLSSYENDPRTTPPDDLRLDVCMSIPAGTEVDHDIQRKMLPGGAYAVMRTELTGAEEYEAAWNDIASWAEQQGHPADLSRPCYEIYLNNPEEHPQKHQILDICLSVTPIA
ncbi:MAG: GyrI-like domain-containing protein [Gammaproteobacteria bacterium]